MENATFDFAALTTFLGNHKTTILAGITAIIPIALGVWGAKRGIMMLITFAGRIFSK